MSRQRLAAAAIAAAAIGAALAPALAADGEILITQAKALQGGITPGDAPGYPITISRSGVYKVATSLAGAAGKAGFSVSAKNVTIDFAGFGLVGKGVATRGVNASEAGLTLQNGTIEGFQQEGVRASNDTHAFFWNLINMRIVNNGGDGLFNDADFQRVLNSTFVGNGGRGVVCDDGCHIEGSVIGRNGADGVNIANGTVLGSTIVDNANFGILSFGDTGFGNNTLRLNNSNGAQTSGVIELQPNFCAPAC